jgi:hypothetical protein
MLMKSSTDNNQYTLYFLGEDKIYTQGGNGSLKKITSTGYAYCELAVVHKNGTEIISPRSLNEQIKHDFNSIWMKVTDIVSVNDNGEVIAQGETIYGEKHIMLLTPVAPK